MDCEDDVELAYVAVAFSRLLSASGTDEIWEHHRVPEGELPNMREIDTYDGIVITEVSTFRDGCEEHEMDETFETVSRTRGEFGEKMPCRESSR